MPIQKNILKNLQLVELKPRQVQASIPSEHQAKLIEAFLLANDERLYHCWRMMATGAPR